MSVDAYQEQLDARHLIIAVQGGQLYAGPAHRLTPDNQAYLKQHASAIIAAFGTVNTDQVQALTPIGEAVLMTTPGAPSAASPAPLSSTPAPAPSASLREEPVDVFTLPPRPVQFDLPEPVARLLDDTRHGRLPKGTQNVGGQMIADFPGYVQTYTVNLLIGDRADALRRLLTAAEILK